MFWLRRGSYNVEPCLESMNAASMLKLSPSCSRLYYMFTVTYFTGMYKKCLGSGYSFSRSKLYISLVNCSLFASWRTEARKKTAVVLMAAGCWQLLQIFSQEMQAFDFLIKQRKIQKFLNPFKICKTFSAQMCLHRCVLTTTKLC